MEPRRVCGYRREGAKRADDILMLNFCYVGERKCVLMSDEDEYNARRQNRRVYRVHYNLNYEADTVRRADFYKFGRNERFDAFGLRQKKNEHRAP